MPHTHTQTHTHTPRVIRRQELSKVLRMPIRSPDIMPAGKGLGEALRAASGCFFPLCSMEFALQAICVVLHLQDVVLCMLPAPPNTVKFRDLPLHRNSAWSVQLKGPGFQV